MRSTTRWAIPYPEGTDVPQAAVDMGNIAQRVDAIVGSMIVAADGSALPGSPTTGMVVWRVDQKRGYVWDSGAWTPVFGRMPFCYVYRATSQSIIGDGSTVSFVWDGEAEDLDGMHGAGAGGVIIPYTGRWLVNVLAGFAASGTGSRFTGIQGAGGTNGVLSIERWQPTAAGAQSQGCQYLGNLLAGTTLTGITGQTSGAALASASGAGSNYMQVQMLGPA